MENNKIVKNIINVCTRLENLCEGFDISSKSALISSKLKVLLAIQDENKISPSMLIEKVGLAKSNIALLCKNLISENLIKSEKDGFDSRIIFYSITEKGNNFLDETLNKMAFNFNREIAYKNNIKEIEQSLLNLKNLID